VAYVVCITEKPTEDTTIVQARVFSAEAHQLDADLVTLGLRTRSDAIREGLRLLHREARQAALAQEYDLFYGTAEAPVSDVAAVGDRVAAEAMRLVDANR